MRRSCTACRIQRRPGDVRRLRAQARDDLVGAERVRSPSGLRAMNMRAGVGRCRIAAREADDVSTAGSL